MIHSLIAGVSGGPAVKGIPQKPALEICEVSTPQKTPINEIVHIALDEEDTENNVIYHHPSGGGGHVTTDSPESHVTGHVTDADAAAYACKYCKRPYINRTG